MIYLRIPTTPGKPIPQDLTRWLIWLAKNHETNIDFSQTNTGVGRNRNVIVEEFLKTSYEHLYMLDDDVIPPMSLLRGPGEVLSGLYSHLIGGGICYSAWMRSDDGFRALVKVPEKPFKCDAVGGGVLRIHRKVLEKIGHPWFEERFEEGTSQLALGEDFDFSEKVKEAGFEITVEPRYLCHHFKAVSLLLAEAAAKNTMIAQFKEQNGPV